MKIPPSGSSRPSIYNFGTITTFRYYKGNAQYCHNVRSAASAYGARHGKSFACRMVKGGIEVYLYLEGEH